MTDLDSRFRQYYAEDEYKGFHKSNVMSSQVSGRIHLVFTNGQKEIEASGDFAEDALVKIFDKVDKYHAQKDGSMNR